MSSHSLSTKLSTSVLTTWSITYEPWNYAAPHIIRDDTDVRIIEREDSPRRPRVAYPTDPPMLRRTHPAARKAMPVRMQIFVHFAFCHPSGRPASRRSAVRRLLVQESVTARLRSDAQVHHAHHGSRDYSDQCHYYLWS